MRALTLQGYEGLASLKLADLPTPTLRPQDVLIRVRAASMNPIDVKFAQGALRERFNLSLPHVLGRDCAGIVLAVGSSVSSVKPGDEVYAVADPLRWGTHAEEVVIDASTAAVKPRKIDFTQAGSLPLAGLSALAGLVIVGDLKKDERVLIHAGAGGVGCLAIQLAKHLGAFVATTVRAGNLDFVRSLGADLPIDYASEDFASSLKDFDLVFDIVGGDVRFRSFKSLRSGGRLIHLSTPPMKQTIPRDDVVVTQATVSYKTEFLNQLSDFVQSGAIRPIIWRRYPFSEARKAYEAVMAAGARGKIVMEMNA